MTENDETETETESGPEVESTANDAESPKQEPMAAGGPPQSPFVQAMSNAMGNGEVPLWFVQNGSVTPLSLNDRFGRSGHNGNFGGNRDLYETLGYKDILTVGDYWKRFLRQDIARRLVEAEPNETWSEAPEVVDEADAEETDFEMRVTELFDETDALKQLQTADVLSGIGHFGVMVIGFADGQKLSEPVTPGEWSGGDIGDAVKYLTPLAEDAVKKVTLNEDTQSERFGEPEMYRIDFSKGTPDAHSETTPTYENVARIKDVHWSRVIRIDETLERPRLEAVWNRLVDIEKVIGSSAELAWRGADYGLIITADPEVAKELSTEQRRELETDVETEAQAWYHGLQPTMQLSGFNVETLGGESINPEPIVQENLKLIAGARNIPVRILVGSERGELASTQDRANWLEHIAQRQQSYAETVIFRPFIDRLMMFDVVPEPRGGRYEVEWPPLFELSELEKADVRAKNAKSMKDAAAAMTTGFPATPGEVRQEMFDWGVEIGSETGENEDGLTEDPTGTTDPDPEPDTDPADEIDENDPEVEDQFRDGQQSRNELRDATELNRALRRAVANARTD